ncbi:hypothetical protein ACU8OG_20695 [Rhizobium leguminosarum]
MKLSTTIFAALLIFLHVRHATAEEYIGEFSVLNAPRLNYLLNLEFKEAGVEGALMPMAGYDDPPIVVDGTNLRPGELVLTFHLKKPVTVTFKKSVNGDLINWWADGAFFRRYSGGLSEGARTLSWQNCSNFVGTLVATPKPDVTNRKLKDFFAREKELAQLKVTAWSTDDDRKVGSFAALFSNVKSFKSNLFDVPIGSEVTVVQTLRKSGLFSKVDIPEGGCGGGYVSQVGIRKASVFTNGKFDEQRFKEFITKNFTDFLASSGSTYRMESKKTIPLKIRPYYTTFIITAAADSKQLRGINGFWDHFTAVFSPAETSMDSPDSIAVNVDVQSATSAKRIVTSDEPPSADYFKQLLNDDETFVISEAIGDFISSKSGGYCYFEGEGIGENSDEKRQSEINKRLENCR